VKTDTGSGPVRHILIVEDNRGDVLLVEVALREAGLQFELIHMADGEKAVDYLLTLGNGHSGQSLDLVLLDLNLPKRDGWEVLETLRSVPLQQPVPVMILSSSSAPHDMARAERLGVSKYIRKPSTLDEYLAIGQVVKQFWPASGQ
jgi:two-component system, chemotaxis family, response regulator Rcp1